MELKVGDLVQHVRNKEFGIVLTRPEKWRDCTVCVVQWCFIHKKHLIDIDFLDKLDKR